MGTHIPVGTPLGKGQEFGQFEEEKGEPHMRQCPGGGDIVVGLGTNLERTGVATTVLLEKSTNATNLG